MVGACGHITAWLAHAINHQAQSLAANATHFDMRLSTSATWIAPHSHAGLVAKHGAQIVHQVFLQLLAVNHGHRRRRR